MNEPGSFRVYALQRAFAAWWAVPLRAIVGYGFIAHGLAKLSRGPSAFSDTLNALGVPAPEVMAWATILVELIGGSAVLVGAFVWVASIPMAVVLLVAMFTVHLPHGFEVYHFGEPMARGYEYVLALILLLLVVIVLGAGPISIDGAIARRRGNGTDSTLDLSAEDRLPA